MPPFPTCAAVSARPGAVSPRPRSASSSSPFWSFLWIAALQFQVYELADTISMQRVRIAQLEKQAKKQNNMLYSASQTLDDIEKKWHRLNFRVLENTWRIEEPEKDPDSL